MTVRSVSLRQNPAYRPGISLFLVAVLSAACTRSVPHQPVPVTVEPEVSRPVVRTFWRPQIDPLSHDYTITQRAMIVSRVGDSTFVDSTTLTVDGAVRSMGAGRIAGIARSVMVGSPGSSPAPLPRVSVPFAFTSNTPPPGMAATIVSQPEPRTPCDPPVFVALNAFRDVAFRTPDSLAAGVTWSDSSVALTCRDGAQITLASRRLFRVVDHASQDGREVLHVDRTVRMNIGGRVARPTDTTTVSGTGESTLRFVLDASSGSVLSATGSSVLDVVVRSAVREETARQTSTVRIERRDPNR